MKILYIAGLYPKDQEKLYKNYCTGPYLQTAPNNYQWAFVEGLVENNYDFYIITAPFLPTFPLRYKRSKVDWCSIKLNDKTIGEVLPYSTIIGFKELSISHNLRKVVTTWISEHIEKDEKFCVLTYTPYSPFIKALAQIKRKHHNMILCSIVTDLVDDMLNFDANKSLLKRLQVDMEVKSTKRNYGIIDKFVLISKAMQERIPQAIGKSIVIEGIAPTSFANDASTMREKYTIFYAGTFQEYAGVKNLVDAFMRIKNPEFCLKLCGYGGCQSYIEDCAKIDGRIEYLGSLSRDEVVKLQRISTLLINPRKPNGKITKYSFPSKTMEYMLSGTPMLGYKLEGIPEEYYQYMFTPNNNSVDALADKIEEILNLPSSVLQECGEKAKQFVVSKKNSMVQVKKCIDFINCEEYENSERFK